MDIAEFKKYAFPNIEAGKMVNLVRRTIKEVQYSKQDAEEKQKEIYKPIIEKLEEEAKEISDLRKALEPTEEQAALPAPPEQAALPASVTQAIASEQPGPSTSKKTKITVDLDAGYSERDKKILNELGLKLPSKLLEESLKDKDLLSKVLNKTATLNKSLGGKKDHEKVAIVKNYRDQLRRIDAEKKSIKKGSGMRGGLRPPSVRTKGARGEMCSPLIYYKNPRELLDRLELLGGTIAAGNNSSKVKNEFSKIVHVLHKLNVINNDDVINLLRGIIPL